MTRDCRGAPNLIDHPQPDPADRPARIVADAAPLLGQRGEVVAAYLYGSILSCDDPRDIDVAVVFARGTGRLERLALCEAIGRDLDRLGSVKPQVSDVRSLNDAPLSFRYRVIQTGELLPVGIDRERVSFEAETRVAWFDFRPTWESYNKQLVRSLARG